MKRREFIQSLLAFLLAGEKFLSAESFNAVEVEGEDPYRITKKALETFGFKNFISRSDVVLVKPNIGWDRKPEQAANTNPYVVKAIVEEAYNAGAKKVLVLDNPCNHPRRTYIRSGIAKAASQAGAEVIYLRDSDLKQVDFKGEFVKKWKVYRQALEVDKIVNVPIVKHHSLARATLGMKNLMGLIGGRRGYLHRNIHVAVVDLAAFFKPHITIIDAYRVLTAHGPQGGNLKDVKLVKKVLITKDIAGADAWGAGVLGLTPQQLPCIAEAEARGLGNRRLRIKRLTV